MSGFIINGVVEPVDRFKVVNYLDDVNLKLAPEDCRPRRASWVRAITLHSTAGLPKEDGDPRQWIRPMLGPSTRAARRINGWWKRDGRCAGSHVLIDFDGVVAQLADLQRDTAFHAGPVNDVSIGIEINQDPNDASMYDGQLDVVVEVVDWLTKRFRIQRQVPKAYRGFVIPRLAAGGEDVVGVYGHRDVTTTRGQGDPGDAVFLKLLDAGYESLDFLTGEDKVVWAKRQAEYGMHGREADGIPGIATSRVLEVGGKRSGQWVPRPGDG